jgi:hypothetical protein
MAAELLVAAAIDALQRTFQHRHDMAASLSIIWLRDLVAI